MNAIRVLLPLALAALILQMHIAFAGADNATYPQPPAGCFIVGITSSEDEGFPVARCIDGSYIYADMDGDGRDPLTQGRWLDASDYIGGMELFGEG